MSEFDGFGELRKSVDLVRKLEFDLDRINKSPKDQYAAFDFFVTAEHIIDWLFPNSRKDREDLRASSPLLRITSHIANGAKHFEAKAKHHTSVISIKKDRYVEPGYIEEGYFLEPLLLQISKEEASNLKTDTYIEAPWLAKKVLEYWKNNEKIV